MTEFLWNWLFSRERVTKGITAAFLGLFVFSQTVHAERIIGLSAFGIQSPNFQGAPCNRFREILREANRPAIAMLFDTFGKDNSCLKAFLDESIQAGKKPIVQVHFSNEAGRRNDFLDEFDFQADLNKSEYNKLLEKMSPMTKKIIAQRVQSILKLFEPYEGNVELLLSTGLEDNFSDKAWSNLYQEIRAEWPFEIVRNRVRRSKSWEPPQGVWEEAHRYKAVVRENTKCVLNGDGQDLKFLPNSGMTFMGLAPSGVQRTLNWIERGVENDCIMFMWAAKWQGYFKGKQVPKPLQRKFKVDAKDVEIMRSFVSGQEISAETIASLKKIQKKNGSS